MYSSKVNYMTWYTHILTYMAALEMNVYLKINDKYNITHNIDVIDVVYVKRVVSVGH